MNFALSLLPPVELADFSTVKNTEGVSQLQDFVCGSVISGLPVCSELADTSHILPVERFLPSRQ